MTGTSIIPSLVAVIIIAKINKFIQRFIATGTTSPNTAKTLEELKLDKRVAFRKMLKHKVIIETNPNRYYLSEENLEKYRNTRRTIMSVIIIILAILILIDALFLNFR